MEVIGRDDYFRGRLSCQSDLLIPGKIKENLKKKMKERFQKLFFGVFYDMIEIIFQGQPFLHVIFKQDSRLTRGKLIFHVNNCMIEFGPNWSAIWF